ncbi:tyrosine-type recombinase/integrase [Acinetobacter boissieri]|uniref:Tyr recombinase domain-containing protein n=1 Tax=Acinetobacter boissieri TaxID=1219383 RepID=A0A1G6HE12_9GAMM|nr:tyrosine-type recombinase/integrase [Acinetobacter boissieri]SDB92328.1 protein of unknown function [Acinetobacter boissieri]
MKRNAIKRFPMSDTVLIALEPEDKDYRVKDSENLYFSVSHKGNKRWDFRYKDPITQKWAWLGLGSFNEVSGKLARKKADEWKTLISQGISPKDYKEEKAKEAENNVLCTFKYLADNYCLGKKWTDDTRKRNEGSLKNHVYPLMGKRDYRKITKKEWLELFQEIQKKPHPKTGKPIIEMGNRVRGLCKDIYDLAEVTGLIDYNPISGIHKFLEKHEKKNMAHVAIDELPALLQAIRRFPSRQTSIGLELSILFGCRPSEMRKAVWEEFNFDKKLWTIPAHRMKKRIEHVIPLPKQAIALLEELKQFSGNSPYLFRGRSRSNIPISNNTFGKALKEMGYQGKQTPHGFRHILSTALREHGFQREWVESALAHKVGGVEGVYNKAVYLNQRTQMMQIWANYLDALAEDKEHDIPSNIDMIGDLIKRLDLSTEQSTLLKVYFDSMTDDSEIDQKIA